MGFWERFIPVSRERMRQEIQAALKAAVGTHLLATASEASLDMPDVSLYANQYELLRQSPSVATALEIKGRVVAQAGIRVKRVDGEWEEELDDHPFERLLRHPNDTTSKSELFTATTTSLDVTGNAYWWLNRAGPGQPPDEIWYIDSSRILPKPDGRLGLAGYEYLDGGQSFPLQTWEVVHWKRYNPFNPYIGLSLMESLAVTILGDISARKWNAKLFGENNARLPGMVLFSDMINNSDWQRIQEEFRRAAAKREQLMLRGVGSKVEWKQASATQREMEFLEGLDAAKVLVWDAIVPGLASMISGNATEASSKTGETVFRNYAIYPRHVELAEKINHSIMPVYGKDLVFEFDDIRITDQVLKLRELEAYERAHTLNEVRMEKYFDQPLNDERGDMLMSEIGKPRAAKDAKVEPPVEMSPMQNPSVSGTPVKAKVDYLPELRKWKAKARKNGAGKETPFESDLIPASVAQEIAARLPATKSKHEIDMLFDEYIVPLTKRSSVDDTDSPFNDLLRLVEKLINE